MDLATRLVHALTAAGRTVAVAESLTGGLVTATLVAVPGASECLRGGVVAYAPDLKERLLDVPGELLDRSGAVDPEVALAMARGVALRLAGDYGLATTGVAGPTPSEGHPVGEFHVAVHGPGVSRVVSEVADGGRQAIREAACRRVLELAVTVIPG